MKTKQMQKRLEDLLASGKIEPGKTYDLMPSDCRGDRFDVAMTNRTDESGDYEVSGHLMRVECQIKVGSRNWARGIPAGYTLECDPIAPYKLKPGEHAEVVERVGNKIGNRGFMARTLASITIIRENGSKVYRNNTPYWIKNTNTYASHYLTGRNKTDEAAYQTELAQLENIAATINSIEADEDYNRGF